jgi:hypothetical protein
MQKGMLEKTSSRRGAEQWKQRLHFQGLAGYISTIGYKNSRENGRRAQTLLSSVDSSCCTAPTASSQNFRSQSWNLAGDAFDGACDKPLDMMRNGHCVPKEVSRCVERSLHLVIVQVVQLGSPVLHMNFRISQNIL